MNIFVHKCCFNNKYSFKSLRRTHIVVFFFSAQRDAGAAVVTNELILLLHVSWI